MSKDMLGMAVRKLVTLPGPALGIVCDLLEKVADPDWVKATKKFLRKQDPWAEVSAGAKKATSNLLELVTTVSTPAIPTFCAKDHFKADRSGEVKIGYISDYFRDAFLSGGKKVGANIAAATLRIHKLVASSVDIPIITELGGEEVAETTLAQMYELMKAQGQGQQGILFTSGDINIFYVRDAKGTLWAVSCFWFSYYGGWGVSARSVADPSEWFVGRQVFSRDSLLTL